MHTSSSVARCWPASAPHSSSAWDGFDQSVRLHPDWPYARFGLALTALEIYLRRYPLPADYDDVASGTHYDGYARQIERTLRAEPGFQPAIDWVVETMIAGEYQQPASILDALRFIADSTDVPEPGIELALARADVLLGDPAQSMRRINAYRREGGDPGVAFLEEARALAAMGSLDSAAARYLAGVWTQSAATKDAYGLDIDWVVSPDERAQYGELPADSTGEFIAAFWSARDARMHRPTGSQLREHLRRWVYVKRAWSRSRRSSGDPRRCGCWGPGTRSARSPTRAATTSRSPGSRASSRSTPSPRRSRSTARSATGTSRPSCTKPGSRSTTWPRCRTSRSRAPARRAPMGRATGAATCRRPCGRWTSSAPTASW